RARASSTMSPSKDAQNHAPGAGGQQCPGRFARGAARRHHVVDEQDRGCLRNLDRRPKSTANVVTPSAWRQRGLHGSGTNTAEPTRSARQAKPSCQTPRKRQTLVVAAAPTPTPVKRDRNDGVGTHFAQLRFGTFGPKLSDEFREDVAAQVLEPQDYVAEQAFVRPQPQDALESKRGMPAPRATLRQRCKGKWANGCRTPRTAREWIGRQCISTRGT